MAVLCSGIIIRDSILLCRIKDGFIRRISSEDSNTNHQAQNKFGIMTLSTCYCLDLPPRKISKPYLNPLPMQFLVPMLLLQFHLPTQQVSNFRRRVINHPTILLLLFILAKTFQ